MRPALGGGSGGGGGGGSGGGFGFFLSWPGGVVGLGIIRSFLYIIRVYIVLILRFSFLVVVLFLTVITTTIRVLAALAVEWRHGVPKIRLTATNAGMAGLNRPANGVVELYGRAIVITPFTLTTEVF
jgi:hypothetical protein